MAAVKTLRENLSNDGLRSFVVTFRDGDEATPYEAQYWAEDAGHAGEQCEDESPEYMAILIETQEEWEARNGRKLDYGNTETL